MQDTDLILDVLTRIPLPPGPITLFKILYESPVPLSRTQIAERIRNSDEKSLIGVFAVLAKRVNGTPGLEGTQPGYEFLISKDETRDDVFFQMRPELRLAIEKLPKLRRVMSKTVEEIHSKYEEQSSWPVFRHSGKS